MARGKNNQIRIVLLLVTLSAFLAFLSVFIENKNEDVLETIRIPISVEISNVTGIKLENSSLDFGRIIPGSSASKKIRIMNNHEFPVYSETNVNGNVSDFIIVEPLTFLNGSEEKYLTVSINIFEQKDFGVYSGELIITFKKA